MREDEYKDVYQRIINTKCVFEKTILLQFADCEFAEKRLLAEREAVNCLSESCQYRCQKFLNELREKARFSLQQTAADSPLPHAKELKVQAGGIFGLQQCLENGDTTHLEQLTDSSQRFNRPTKPVADINQTLTNAMDRFNQQQSLPYAEIIKTILRFEIRKSRRSQRHPQP